MPSILDAKCRALSSAEAAVMLIGGLGKHTLSYITASRYTIVLHGSMCVFVDSAN